MQNHNERIRKMHSIIRIITALFLLICLSGCSVSVNGNPVYETKQENSAITEAPKPETPEAMDETETKHTASAGKTTTTTETAVADEFTATIETTATSETAAADEFTATIETAATSETAAADTAKNPENSDTKINIGGRSFSSQDTGLDLSDIDFTTLDTPIEDILPLFPNLTKVTMIHCGYNNEQYAALCDANPDIKFVWEIVMSHWTVRTDQVAFGTFKTCDQTFFLHDDEAQYLKYCTDLVALDLGHNYVTDFSFLQHMPELKVLILVDNVRGYENGKLRHVNDMSDIRYCTKLEYLEIFCNGVSDISFIASLPNLTDLNISYNPIPTDMAQYLYHLPKLERLWMEHTKISYDEFTRLQESYPNAELHYYGEGSIDHNWRTGSHYEGMRNMLKNNVIDPVYAD